MIETEDKRSLEEILQSTSEMLFPHLMGEEPVTINSRSSTGDSAVHSLVWRKDFYGIQRLLEAGADVNAIGEMGETPLHVAISMEDTKIIQLLLRFNPRLDIVSEFDETAIEKAKAKNIKLQ